MAVAVLLLSACVGLGLETGLGGIIDAAGGLLLGTIALLVIMAVVMLGLALVRRIPPRLAALLAATLLCLLAAGQVFGLSFDLLLRLSAWPFLSLALAGAGIAILLRRRPGRLGWGRTVMASVLLFAGVTGAAVFIGWLALPGTDPFLENTRPAAGGHVVPLEAPDPAQTGPYPVARLFYGSGTDRRRPEYGASVSLKTDPVDASSFAVPAGRFSAWARRHYWGFEPNSLPLNARVWYPEGGGPFPLVLIVHGNHRMEQFSDPGFAYLGELLASRGFIVASVDENFLNGTWYGDFGEERGARAWLILKHLELWRLWNQQEGNPFYGKLDLTNIALIGHSRGGEAILHATRFNGLRHHPENGNVPFHFGFQIKTLIAIAPTDGQYRPTGPPIPIQDINYLVLHGSHDGDVCGFIGARRYQRITFTGQTYRIKAALYIHRANHSQFNTAWGQCDATPPLSYLLNRRGLLRPEEQRRIAKVYISAFLEATLHGQRQYVSLFRDPRRAAHWLPDTMYLSRFQDADFRTIADFDDPIAVTETVIPGGTQRGQHLETWKPCELKTRQGQSFGDYAVALGWNTVRHPGDAPTQIPRYIITLPEIPALAVWQREGLALSFCLADTGKRGEPAPQSRAAARGASPSGSPGAKDAVKGDEDRTPIDMTLELVAANDSTARLPLSHCRPLQRAIKVTFSKWPYWERLQYRSPVEPVLQTFEIPLADFAAANPQFDPALLKEIRFVFDRTESAVILLDQVGITRIRDIAKKSP